MSTNVIMANIPCWLILHKSVDNISDGISSQYAELTTDTITTDVTFIADKMIKQIRGAFWKYVNVTLKSDHAVIFISLQFDTYSK